MKPLFSLCLCVVVALSIGHLRGEDSPTVPFSVYQHEQLGLSVIKAELMLPFGTWESAGNDDFRQVYIEPSESAWEASESRGERYSQVVKEEKNRQGGNQLWSINWAVRKYAEAHDWLGPESILVLSEKDQALFDQDGKRYALLAKVKIAEKFDPARKEILAAELTPYLDDGKHYVLYANGRVERVNIDQEWLVAHALTVVPRTNKEDKPASISERVSFVLYAQVRGDIPALSDLTITALSGDTHIVKLRRAAEPGTADILKEWADIRCWMIAEYADPRNPIMLDVWAFLHQQVYGVDGNALNDFRRAAWGRRGNLPTPMGVFGGRAAVRETLQMQAIGGRLVSMKSDKADELVPISSIPGVEVQSHAYADMLAGQAGGRLAAADLVPHDRLMIHAARPAALLGMLDGGHDFAHYLGVMGTGNSLDYGLKARYFERLGMNEECVRTMLKSPFIEDVTLILPDLFFIEGSDISAVLTIQNLQMIKPLLALIGAQGLNEGVILPLTAVSGEKSYWAIQGSHLFLSTNRGELVRSLELADAGGVGSLGQSAEFRYMLTKLAPSQQTQVFAYLSDPFIRQLVSPATKINQLRRLQAKATLEVAAAAQLMARMDGQSVSTLAQLQDLGYLPASLDTSALSLTAQGQPSHAIWGTIHRMKTLLEVPITQATSKEAEAYKRYMDNYSRFWRQFFDPIAVRLDATGDKEHELSMFILPLIDSSIYNGLKGFLMHQDGNTALQAPRLQPEPVLMMSANLGEAAWTQLIGNLKYSIRKTGIDPAVLDVLGPGLHLAIMDADPIISLGSGDVFGAFGGQFFGRRSEMVMIPVAASFFTRPCQIVIEVQDEDLVRQALQQLCMTAVPDGDVRVSAVRIGDRDTWMINFHLFGMFSIRLGAEVRDGYLALSNVPWSQLNSLTGEGRELLATLGIRISPTVGIKQQPGLHAAASEKQRHAAYAGAGLLYPFMLAGTATADEAARLHQQQFGFQPVHPAEGRWFWLENQMHSSLYGTPAAQRQPAYEQGDRDFGVLRQIDDMTISMQFEEGGLRTRCRWISR